MSEFELLAQDLLEKAEAEEQLRQENEALLQIVGGDKLIIPFC